MKLEGANGYVRDGGDILQDFIDACREFGQMPFVSLRLNDGHHIEWCETKHHVKGIHGISRFLMENKHLMFGGDLTKWDNRCMNWIYPVVTEHLCEIIKEQCENYDIDGYELDFMCHPHMFDVSATTSEERRAVTEGFIKNVRAILDRTERGGKHRYLCIRVPSNIKMWDALGLLPENIASLGVEMVNVSSHYYIDQWIDFEEFTKRMPTLAVYFEVCNCSHKGTYLKQGCYDNHTYRRATENEIYTAAHMAYKAGAQGMSYFNFVYYREHGVEGRGPFNEPPFHAIGNAKDVDFVASAPGHFFIAKGWEKNSQLHKALVAGENYSFEIYMQPPSYGWSKNFRFRIHTASPIENRSFDVTFGGVKAIPTSDISEPYPEDNEYPPLHADETNCRAYVIPKSAVIEDKNLFTVRMNSSAADDKIVIWYIDIFPN